MAAATYEHTATGVLGDKRDTMLLNQLHLRNEVGKASRHGYSYVPPESYRYGICMNVKEGGVRDSLTWSSHLPSLTGSGKNKKSRTRRDFEALNKGAISAGLVNEKGQYAFRATHDARRPIDDDVTANRKPGKTKIPDMTFGMPVRPSTPIYEVIEHKFQDLWIRDQMSQTKAKKVAERAAKLKPGQINDTRTSILRQHQVAVDPAPLWQMKKFNKSAKPHLSTFRTEKAKQEAFKHQTSDGVPRKGLTHQGVYETGGDYVKE